MWLFSCALALCRTFVRRREPNHTFCILMSQPRTTLFCLKVYTLISPEILHGASFFGVILERSEESRRKMLVRGWHGRMAIVSSFRWNSVVGEGFALWESEVIKNSEVRLVGDDALGVPNSLVAKNKASLTSLCTAQLLFCISKNFTSKKADIQDANLVCLLFFVYPVSVFYQKQTKIIYSTISKSRISL